VSCVTLEGEDKLCHARDVVVKRRLANLDSTLLVIGFIWRQSLLAIRIARGIDRDDGAVTDVYASIVSFGRVVIKSRRRSSCSSVWRMSYVSRHGVMLIGSLWKWKTTI